MDFRLSRSRLPFFLQDTPSPSDRQGAILPVKQVLRSSPRQTGCLHEGTGVWHAGAREQAPRTFRETSARHFRDGEPAVCVGSGSAPSSPTAGKPAGESGGPRRTGATSRQSHGRMPLQTGGSAGYGTALSGCTRKVCFSGFGAQASSGRGH